MAPPRGGACAAEAVEDAQSALATLPHAVAQLIFAQLPADLRARCACVCRGWRDALAVRSLWTRLDVSCTSGVAVEAHSKDALLRGAAARAGGALEALDVSGITITHEALLAVVAANSDTLRRLRVCPAACVMTQEHDYGTRLLLSDAEALLRAASRLRVFDACVDCDSIADARRALRTVADEGLLAPLRVHGLLVRLGDGAALAAEADLLALAADMAAHAYLQELRVTGASGTPAVLDSFLDAALARRLAVLSLMSCGFTATSAPALARLLAGSALTHLHVSGGRHEVLLDAPAAALLAGALRANSTLLELDVAYGNLVEDVPAAVTLLGALVAHPSLRTLMIGWNEAYDGEGAPIGAALGALVAANAPALTELCVMRCNLGDAGLAPLFEALPRNTHLRSLSYSQNGITEACATDVLLPTVRANGSLRELSGGHDWPAVDEAEEIVKRRTPAR
jgi:hypothetical protein